jgi:hypothetical protein
LFLFFQDADDVNTAAPAKPGQQGLHRPETGSSPTLICRDIQAKGVPRLVKHVKSIVWVCQGGCHQWHMEKFPQR